MSDSVFPTLPGINIKQGRSPVWRSVVHESVSGRSVALSAMTYPRWKYKLSFEFLRSGAEVELQSLVGFYNHVRGRADTFLFYDEDDNFASNQAFGTADGVTTQFKLARALGGFVEPINGILSEPIVYVDGVQVYGHDGINLFLRSEEIDNSYWSKSSIAVTANTTTSPAGDVTADSVVEGAAAALHHFSKTVDFTAGVTYTTSLHVKPLAVGSARYVVISFPSAAFGTVLYGIFNPSTGAVVSSYGVTTHVESAANGFWRFGITAAATITVSGGILFRINSDGVTYNQNYTGDGVSGWYGWGVMLEESDAMSQYIKSVSTQGVALADFAWDTSGNITFATAPVSGLLTWTGTYYQRCRFDDDILDASRFMWRLWEARQVNFTTVKA